MIEISFSQLHLWLTAFLWPFVRLTAFIMASPLWGHSSVPRQAKLALAAIVCFVVVPTLPAPPQVPVWSWAGVGILVEQVVIGVALGLTVTVTLAAVQAAGEFIGLQMGLGFATFFSPDTGANTMILSRIFYMITLLMFLAVDAHLITLETLVFSFEALPVGLLGLNPSAFEMLARFGSIVFVAGMLLAIPLVGALLIVNLSLGILNRSAPQLTVFSVGFPTSLLLGLVLLTVLMTDFGRYLHSLFNQGLGFMRELLVAMAG